MTATITRLYDDYATASQAVTSLESAGVPQSDISIVSNNSDNWYSNKSGKVDRDRDGVDDRAEGAAKGAGIGATVGGVAGLLAGLGMIAIPGVGPVVAAGWLVATLTGAAAVGTLGGVVGALTQSGVSEKDAHVYAEGVRRGGTLVSARVPDGDKARYEAILKSLGREYSDPRRSVPFVRLEWLRSEGSTIYCRAGTGRTRTISRQINACRIKEGASGVGAPFLN